MELIILPATLESLTESIGTVADWLTLHVTMWALVGVGLFLTVVSRGVQLRHFPRMVSTVLRSRERGRKRNLIIPSVYYFLGCPSRHR